MSASDRGQGLGSAALGFQDRVQDGDCPAGRSGLLCSVPLCVAPAPWASGALSSDPGQCRVSGSVLRCCLSTVGRTEVPEPESGPFVLASVDLCWGFLPCPCVTDKPVSPGPPAVRCPARAAPHSGPAQLWELVTALSHFWVLDSPLSVGNLLALGKPQNS